MNRLIRSVAFVLRGGTRRYPSPSLVVSITALVVALGGAGYSATGGNFILGQANKATTQTALSASLAGIALKISNPHTAAKATALRLNVASGHPPFTVNSSGKVPFLNADLLDGLNSTQFARKRTIPFNLGSGAISAPIAVPANQLVYLMGAVTGPSNAGVGQATLFRFPGAGIMWMGLTHTGGDGGVTANIASGTGTGIIRLDTADELRVEVSGPDAIRLNNTSANARTGILTLLW